MIADTGAAPAAKRASVVVDAAPLGGSPLSRAIQQGAVPREWALAWPRDVAGWAERARAAQSAFAGRDWLPALGSAISPAGPGRERLERVAAANGIVVTTGQQPGLFGGPIYTVSKALTALALADEIESATGIPAAPLFWAATDDADLAEAQSVWLAAAGGAKALRGHASAPAGTPSALVPQGDLRGELQAVRSAGGSAAAGDLLERLLAPYANPTRSIGSAYLEWLGIMFEPLGIPVLDAADRAVRVAGAPLLRRALTGAAGVDAALAARGAEIRARGVEPQVDEVPGLTLVFVDEGSAKRRLSLDEASRAATSLPDGALGPNVLLRPVVEAAILPTVAYVAGPGELAYFAQVTAVASALGARRPVAVPRWSATIVEPHVQRALDRLGIDRDALADPHAADTALARTAMDQRLAESLVNLGSRVEQAIEAVGAADATELVPNAVIEGLQRRIAHQLARFERRVTAAVKRRETVLMRDVATLRGYFFPGGKRQERALTIVPMVARQGVALIDAMLDAARVHARALVSGDSASPPPPA